MPELLLMRHAKSSWKDADASDHQRPLNGRGRRAAPAVGAALRARLEGAGESIDLVLCSTATRARETLDRMREAAGLDAEERLVDALYLAAPEAILAVVADEAAGDGAVHQRVLVIGHNPGLAHLAAGLTGLPVDMPTAAVAWIALPGVAWPGDPGAIEGRGELRGHLLARDLESGDR